MQKDFKISERIRDELPNFYKKSYVNIQVMDRDRKYPTYMKLAHFNGLENWECAAIATYYKTH